MSNQPSHFSSWNEIKYIKAKASVCILFEYYIPVCLYHREQLVFLILVFISQVTSIENLL